MRPVPSAPDTDGWALIERLIIDQESLRYELWLVVDDAHELDSSHALRQPEVRVMRAPERLRFVLATRRDARMGLHRLRLEGELTEICANDLRFTLAEA